MRFVNYPPSIRTERITLWTGAFFCISVRQRAIQEMVMSPLIAAACSPHPRGLDALISIEDRKPAEQTPHTPLSATPAGRLFLSAQQLPAAREASTEAKEPLTSIILAQMQGSEEAAPSSPPDDTSLLADGDDEEDEEGEEGEEEGDGEEDGVLALLALSGGRPAADRPAPRRAKRASSSATAGPLKRRGVADRASQFTCKHPGCGKLYGCPDAVRKHCRKAHYDWLRSLGPVGPAGYCSWEPCA